ncbi:MAG: HypC/HybG/HupF family hydrogenase formation chaperone [Actinobacteria bacterium]|nr:HypC/HybG/HupF family hydrogenase formation chaperone [Actinomycetota bacterium]
MCLAVPSKIISIDECLSLAEVDVMGNTKKISIAFTPEAHVDNWVLVHAGQAICIISEEEAGASLEIWEEILRD